MFALSAYIIWVSKIWHCMGWKRNVCGVLVGRPEEMRPLGRPRHRWKRNINTRQAAYV